MICCWLSTALTWCYRIQLPATKQCSRFQCNTYERNVLSSVQQLFRAPSGSQHLLIQKLVMLLCKWCCSVPELT